MTLLYVAQGSPPARSESRLATFRARPAAVPTRGEGPLSRSSPGEVAPRTDTDRSYHSFTREEIDVSIATARLERRAVNLVAAHLRPALGDAARAVTTGLRGEFDAGARSLATVEPRLADAVRIGVGSFRPLPARSGSGLRRSTSRSCLSWRAFSARP